MVKEAEQHIEETPASHKKNVQRYAIIGGVVLIGLFIAMLFFKSHQRQAKIEAAQQEAAAAQQKREQQDKQKQKASGTESFDEQLAQRRQALLNKVDEVEQSGGKFDPATKAQIEKIRQEEAARGGNAGQGAGSNRRGQDNTGGSGKGERDPIADFYLKEKLRALGSSIKPYESASGGRAGGNGGFAASSRDSGDISGNGSISDQQRQVQTKIAELKQLKERLTNSDGSPETVSKLIAGNNRGASSAPTDQKIVGFTPSKAAQYNDTTAGKSLLPTGTVISAVLAQQVISDYAGSFKGTITHDVYDPDYEKILVPKGTTVVGKIMRIKNINEPIQARMGMVVTWFVLPNGNRIDMSKASSAQDSAGVSALKGDVNYHFMAQFLGVAAYAVLISESSQNTSSQFTGEVNVEGDIQRSMAEQFSPLAQRYLTLVPTITLQPGTPFKVFVEDDVYLKPWGSIYDKLMSNR